MSSALALDRIFIFSRLARLEEQVLVDDVVGIELDGVDGLLRVADGVRLQRPREEALVHRVVGRLVEVGDRVADAELVLREVVVVLRVVRLLAADLVVLVDEVRLLLRRLAVVDEELEEAAGLTEPAALVRERLEGVRAGDAIDRELRVELVFAEVFVLLLFARAAGERSREADGGGERERRDESERPNHVGEAHAH
jgi:hypothetical protein